MKNPVHASATSREKILAAATKIAQAHGYGGLNMRVLAEDLGIKAASLYYHFPSKADLAANVAKRYWEESAAWLEALSLGTATPRECLHRYPETFRKSLECDNRICLCSFMTAEYDDLPEAVKVEVLAFTEVNVAWLKNTLIQGEMVDVADAENRARAIFAAVSGAQLMARGRADIALFDALLNSYRTAGLIPE
ncbi:transcriptional regulator [Robbsia andropogonis]|uniref:Transcriptional regulator n=1 Tax=Robbsia andropogonis TaxID=28092 RepID=A0A0F5K4G7_9BURK|nr:TetR/AcrR family transcriptional regulator [Robbsia andropogonis]KKB64759.1 transcriptional regulator [Robbsia andropogonis]MCP1117984.1 TetR/AcrR family transcriptional regulator [Robbsia andropogonis]MCP1127449.1 TetR/AcrR family transcriptional regulator [Robbsia andropogonis]